VGPFPVFFFSPSRLGRGLCLPAKQFSGGFFFLLFLLSLRSLVRTGLRKPRRRISRNRQNFFSLLFFFPFSLVGPVGSTQIQWCASPHDGTTTKRSHELRYLPALFPFLLFFFFSASPPRPAKQSAPRSHGLSRGSPSLFQRPPFSSLSFPPVHCELTRSRRKLGLPLPFSFSLLSSLNHNSGTILCRRISRCLTVNSEPPPLFSPFPLFLFPGAHNAAQWHIGNPRNVRNHGFHKQNTHTQRGRLFAPPFFPPSPFFPPCGRYSVYGTVDRCG